MIERDGVGLLRDIGALLAGWPKLDAGLLHKLGDKLGGRDQDAQFDLAVELLGWWFARMARAWLPPEKCRKPELFEGETALIARMQAAASLDRWLACGKRSAVCSTGCAAVNLDRKQAWVAGIPRHRRHRTLSLRPPLPSPCGVESRWPRPNATT